MKRLKMFFAALCAAVLLISALPASTLAANTEGRLVALTFDDGPGKYTESLLDGLEARGVLATFFTLGSKAAQYPELLKRMAAAGHQLASHTYSHALLTKLSATKIKNEISATEELLTAAGGDQTYYIRPPYGSVNKTVKACADAPLITWSVDPLDWKLKDTKKVTDNILSSVKDGDIILLHDIYSTSVQAALNAIDKLQAQGYEFVTVSELLRRRGVEPETGKVYSCARNTGINLGPMDDGSTLPKHWAYEAIEYSMSSGLIDTYADGSYRPDYCMTRGAFASALGRLWENSGGSLTDESFQTFSFTDVPATSLNKSAVQWAANTGIMTGYGYGQFGYYDTLNREQMAICVVRYLEHAGESAAVTGDQALPYRDAETISDWAVAGVKYCTAIGLLKGNENGSFNPKAKMTRAQAATVIQRLAGLSEKANGQAQEVGPPITAAAFITNASPPTAAKGPFAELVKAAALALTALLAYIERTYTHVTAALKPQI